MTMLLAALMIATNKTPQEHMLASDMPAAMAMTGSQMASHHAAHYDPLAVVVSVLVSVIASWVALDLAGRIYLRKSVQSRLAWLIAGAVAMGSGVWAMHYVGMMAYRMDVAVSYDVPTVLLSMLAAIVSSGMALYIVSGEGLSWRRSIGGGVFMGSGIASMHYIGMSAMCMPMDIHYSILAVVLSVLAAVVLSIASLRLAFKSKSVTQAWSVKKAVSALFLGLAISVMHYVGMSAAGWSDASGMHADVAGKYTIEASQLSTTGVISVTALILLLAAISAGFDRRVSGFQSALDGSTRKYSQLRAHNARLQGAFRAGGVGIWECDPVASVFYADHSWRDLYGIPHDGKPVLRAVLKALVHPDDAVVFEQRWNESLLCGDIYENEFRIIRHDGIVRRVRCISSIIRRSDGSAERVLGMTWDVTVEREREIQAADQAARFRMTLESIGDAVISTDENQRVIFLNRVAAELTGWEPEEGCGKSFAEIFITRDEETDELREDPVQRCIESGGEFLSEDGVLVSRNGRRYNIRKHVALMENRGAAVVTFQDITESRRLQKALEHSASHDSLTGLPNRDAFEKVLRNQWHECQLDEQKHCLCILDLDRFKLVNDTSGHLAGDALLREVATMLQTSLMPSDFVARMGGDEFMLLLANTDQASGSARLEQLLETIKGMRFLWRGRVYDISASAGLVGFHRNSPPTGTLISQADVAVFTSKRHGRNQVSVYSMEDGTAAGHLQEMEIVTGMRQSLEQNRFELYVQPIVPTDAAGLKRHFEVLIRMRDEHGEIIPPGAFIPAAERYGLMGPVDRWVIKNVLATYHEFHQEHPNLCFAINLSAESLSDPTLWGFVAKELQKTQIPPAAISFEVTETSLIQNMKNATSFMKQAREAGCRVSLDDFGTGLSSLSYLQQFPVDTIKIDGAFIKNLMWDTLDQSIVRSVAEIARSINVVTVAECVENAGAITLLRKLGIDYVQGWATGKPTPLKSMLELSSLNGTSIVPPTQQNELPMALVN